MAYNRKQRLNDNIKAIETAFILDREQRTPTARERLLLERYCGFGGLKCILNPARELADAVHWAKSDLELFAPTVELHRLIRENSKNESEYKQLMDSLKQSVLTAFYTPSAVTEALTDVLKEHQIIPEKVLEPSAGIGAFVDSVLDNNPKADIMAFEKDLLTGKILRHLHPEQKVRIEGFEKIEKPFNDYFDLAISNIPFGDVAVFDPSYTAMKGMRALVTRRIHNYFFVKALDTVRDGGLVAFITSQGVLNAKNNSAARFMMLYHADLVSAIRLPNNLFTENANTEVGSDLIILQKNSQKESLRGDDNLLDTVYNDENRIPTNNYFLEHPERIIHTTAKLDTDPFGKPAMIYTHEDGVEGIAEDLRKMLHEDFKKNLNLNRYLGIEETKAEEVKEVEETEKIEKTEKMKPSIEEKQNDTVVSLQKQEKPKKRGFFSRLFGKKENAVTTDNRLTQTEKMLTNLNQTVVAKHHQQSRKVVEILDSLGNRNEGINKQLQRVISIADENVDKGIKVRERQIADLEGNYTYYYIGMIGLLILVFFVLFLLVWRFAFKTRKSKEETRKVMLTVTHEMRSPLSAIKDYARKISGLDDATDESKRYADLIVDTSKGLTSMIDSFLVYSKLANGKATVKERPFRMMDIAEQLKMEYEPFAAKKQLELSVNNKADGVVNGDKEKVLTIGRNLLSNAIKYTGKGEIVLSTTYKNGVFMLMVKDTGTGLDDKQQKQIFKEFARLGNAVTQPGFGLGLSIVKNLVSLMKGKIDVSSHQGLGSIFTISLPMAAAEKQNVEPTQYRTKRQDSFTVIAIDDSHVQLSTIREAFASNGIVCDTCNNATDLLDMMRKKSYDLLITDLKMAEVNGIEILEMMRMVNVRNSKTIPVVVMTAAPNVSEQELLDAGFVACLFKPMSDKDLINTARKCVNGKIAEKQIDFSMLLTYGNEKETLENFVKEMTDTLGSIRNAAQEENRKKMSDAIHHARSSWMMVQSDESLNYLFDLIEDSTSSDDVINQAVEDVFAHGEAIIKAAQKKIEEVTA